MGNFWQNQRTAHLLHFSSQLFSRMAWNVTKRKDIRKETGVEEKQCDKWAAVAQVQENAGDQRQNVITVANKPGTAQVGAISKAQK